MKKKLIIATLLSGVLSLIAFLPAPPPPSPTIYYEQTPPYPAQFWVQKLSTPLSTGENIIMRIKFEPGVDVPVKMDIYDGAGNPISFHDDGIAPDKIKNDRIFAAYMTENIPNFLNQVHSMETALAAKGEFIRFEGHLGEMISAKQVTPFDFASFQNNKEVTLNPLLLLSINCQNDLHKEQSLFITDLSVVEDGVRTYNIVADTGNPVGVWTFGNLMKNMANTAQTNVSTKDFMKEWVKNWTVNDTINGQFVAKRDSVLRYLIRPWLRRSNNNPTLTVTSSNWESLWNAANEDSLVRLAPFKLTAIVNRIDLRGNSGYAPSITNAGETRFIFTLILPYPDPGIIEDTVAAGHIPSFGDQDFTPLAFADWEGMNVIFEYGNPQTNRCDLRDFAIRWVNLSSYGGFNTVFNDSLEALTRMVIDASAAPSKINGSAINRIRTNERIFQPIPSSNNTGWTASNWELRQFELDANHYLKDTTVTNTPVNPSNYANQLQFVSTLFSYADISAISAYPLKGNDLVSWVFGHHQLVNIGRHSLPLTYPTALDSLLAGSAIVDGEFAHYWDFDWAHSAPPYYTPMPTGSYQPYQRRLRQQISLNTCQGCHTGETKTIFTQIRPLGYGVSANYWGTVPDHMFRKVDTRFVRNTGISTTATGTVSNYLTSTSPSNQVVLNVSAFLTGRNYTISSIGLYDDDSVSTTEDATDTGMNGLFYVHDPSNGSQDPNNPNNNYIPGPEKMWGYNDLQRRKQDICHFLTSCSNVSSVIGVLINVSFIPFPYASH